MPESASKEASAAAKHANGDLAATAAEVLQAAQAAHIDTQVKQGTAEASHTVKPASNGVKEGTRATTSSKPVQSSGEDSDVELFKSEESETEEITSEQEISSFDSRNDASNRYSAS